MPEHAVIARGGTPTGPTMPIGVADDYVLRDRLPAVLHPSGSNTGESFASEFRHSPHNSRFPQRSRRFGYSDQQFILDRARRSWCIRR